MNLAAAISMYFGGQGSGCHGPNCGRPSMGGAEKPSVDTASKDDLQFLKTNFKATDEDSASALADSLLNWMGRYGDVAHTFVAKDANGSVVGALQWGRTRFKGEDFLEIDALAVHPDILTGKMNVKGTGTSLMCKAASIAAQQGVGISLVASSVGKGFYQKLGMHESEPGSDIFNWSYEEARSFAQHAK